MSGDLRALSIEDLSKFKNNYTLLLISMEELAFSAEYNCF